VSNKEDWVNTLIQRKNKAKNCDTKENHSNPLEKRKWNGKERLTCLRMGIANGSRNSTGHLLMKVFRNILLTARNLNQKFRWRSYNYDEIISTQGFPISSPSKIIFFLLTKCPKMFSSHTLFTFIFAPLAFILPF
jgi:hypothetical protein